MLKNVNKSKWWGKYFLCYLLTVLLTISLVPLEAQAAEQFVTLWDGTTYSVGDGSNGALVVNSNTTISGGKYTNIIINNGATLSVGKNPIYVQGSITGNGCICSTFGSSDITIQAREVAVDIIGYTGSKGLDKKYVVGDNSTYIGGAGGDGGAISITAETITSNISGGNGGIGGNALSAGAGGEGGSLTIKTNTLNGNIREFNGGNGGLGTRPDTGGTTGGKGGTGGVINISAKNINSNITGGNGGTGGGCNGATNSSGGAGGTGGTVNVTAETITSNISGGNGGSGGHGGMGYYTGGAGGTSIIVATSIIGNISCVNGGATNYQYNFDLPGLITGGTLDIKADSIKGDIASANYGQCAPKTNTSKIILRTIFLSSNITYNGQNIQIISKDDNPLILNFNSPLATITTNNLVKFIDNRSYIQPSYWTARNITINGLRVLNPAISASVNSSGLNSIDLSSFNTNYSNYQIDAFDFIIDRKVEGMDNDFVRVDAFTKPLVGLTQWLDWNTVLKKDTCYKVRFRASLGVEPINKDYENKKGFIYMEPFVLTSRSEGYGIDANEPSILQFSVANNSTEVSTDKVDVVLKAKDNRSDRINLVANITVDGTPYYWDGTKFEIADNADHMAPFPDQMTELPLGNMGSKFIVASVRDEAGNVATSTATILYSISSSPSSPEDVKPEDITDGDGEPLVFGAYKGQQVLFCKTDNVILKYDQTKYADSKIKFNFQGFAWSSWENFNKDCNFALSKQEGLVKIRYQIIKPNGEIIKDELLNILVDSTPPTISSIKGNKGATAGTTGGTFTAIVSAKDNISKNLKYSYSINGGNFTEPQELIGGKANITLSSGVNNIEIEILDEVGNSATHQLTAFGL